MKKTHKEKIREIKLFHPSGNPMPNGSYFQRGGFIHECKVNREAYELDKSVHGEQDNHSKCRGGIITFSTDSNAIILSPNMLDATVNQFNHDGGKHIGAYSVGNFFKGKYVGDNGERYNEQSISVEINGLSNKVLLKFAEFLANEFRQKTVLVKDLNNNKIFLVDGKTPVLTHCTNENEDVMKRFYGIHANGCKPHIIERMALDRIIAKYGDNGYACLSASRGDKTDKGNDDATRQLLSDIRAGHWSFLPTYSRFKNIETGEVDGYNPSFIVFNQSKQGDVRDYNDLFDFAKRMCGKYNHDGVMVKTPDKSSIYIDCNGEPCDNTVNEKGWGNCIMFEKNIYVNPIPCTLGERVHRSGFGEIMLY